TNFSEETIVCLHLLCILKEYPRPRHGTLSLKNPTLKVPSKYPDGAAGRLLGQYRQLLILKPFLGKLRQIASQPFRPSSARAELYFEDYILGNIFLNLLPSLHTKIHHCGNCARGCVGPKDALRSQLQPNDCVKFSSCPPSPENRGG